MGYNADGGLGDGTTNSVYTPESIVPGNVVKISGGGSHTLFLKTNGSLWGTGFNGFGEMDDGSTNNALVP